MSRSTIRWTGAACLLVGLAAFGGSRLWWAKPPAVPLKSVAAAAEKVETLQQENLRLVEKLGALREETKASSTSLPSDDAAVAQLVRSEAVRMLAALSKERQIMLDPPDFLLHARPDQPYPGGTEELVKVFGLNPAQATALRDAYDLARRQMEQIVAAHTVMVRQDEFSLVLQVSVAPELRAPREQMRAAYAGILGEENLAAYEALRKSEYVFRELTLDFESQGGVVTIAQNRGDGTFRVETAYRDSSGKSVGMRGIMLRSKAALASRVGSFLHLLPPGMRDI